MADRKFRLLQILQEIISFVLEGIRVWGSGELVVDAERGQVNWICGVGGFWVSDGRGWRRWGGDCLGNGRGGRGGFFSQEVGEGGEGEEGSGDENDRKDGGAEELAGGDDSEHFLRAFASELTQELLQFLDGGIGVGFKFAKVGLGAGHGGT